MLNEHEYVYSKFDIIFFFELNFLSLNSYI